MDSLLSSRFLNKLLPENSTSIQQLISYLSLLHARHYAQGTLKALLVAIKRFLVNLSDLRRAAVADNFAHTNPSDIDSFIDSALSNGLSPATINITLSMLKEFFDFLCEADQMQRQPIIRRRHRLFAPTTLPKPMPEADLIELFKVIDSVRDRLIFLLMLRCGLRVSEVCHLLWNDVDFHAGTLRINNSKGQVDRIAYLAPDVEQALRLWQAHGSSTEYLFPSHKVKSAPLTRGDLGWLMNKYLRLANIPLHYSPHCLRHSFATQLLNAGVSLEVLKELMGHRSIQMTLRYTKLYESTKRQQYDQAMMRIEKRQANLGVFEGLRSRLSKKYVINIFSMLIAVFKVAAHYGYIEEVPLKKELHRPKQKGKDRRKKKPALTVEQVRVVMPFITASYRMLFILIGVAGLRIGEILGLRREDFNYQGLELNVSHSLWRGRLKSTKTEGSEAAIELPEVIADLLNQYLAMSPYKQPTDFMFHKPDGCALDPDWIRESMLSPALDAAGIKREPRQHGWHLLRHSAGSILYTLTGDLKLVQSLLRHTQIATTSDIYVHVEKKVVGAAVGQLAEALLGNCSTTAPQESELIQ